MPAPAAAAIAATSEPVQSPAAKETAQVRPPAQVAVEATAQAEVESATAAETTNEPTSTAEESPAETAQVASTETQPAEPEPEAPAAPVEQTGPVIELPELNIPSNSRAAQLADGAANETVQVQVEAIPAPAPRDLNAQRPDAGESDTAQSDTAQSDTAQSDAGSQQAGAEPAVIDGIAVPDRETLDELEDGAEQVAQAGLPPVDTPALAVPASGGSTNAETAEQASVDQSNVTRVQSTQVAAIPGFEDLRILFNGADATVGPQGTALILGLSQRLNRDESLRLQIRAYAGGTPEAATQARRLSLDRALAVRSMLIDQGVRGTRIDIRALGNSAPEEPRDRVDIIVE
ncbi:MAG: OmpA family protein [Pseudomonadota bacterium]